MAGARMAAAVAALALCLGGVVPALGAAPPALGRGGDAPAPRLPGELKIRHEPFGEVTVYRPVGTAASVALFISGDGGWNLGVVDMARHLLEQGAIVVGIDIRHYLAAVNAPATACRSFAVDFEELAHALEQQLKVEEYLLPVLVGYSSGATLAYATLVQAPKGTFAGALSLGFCPDLPLTAKVCRGSGLEYEAQYPRAPDPAPASGVIFKTAPANATRWVAFQGEADQVCSATATREFVAATANAELVWLPKVGHGYAVERNWLPQFRQHYAQLAARAAAAPLSAPEVRDLPLVEVPAPPGAAGETGLFAVLLTGDGGWSGIDQDVAAALAAGGVPVVGFNTLKYFWHARTPEAAARDLERVIRRYHSIWNRPQLLLVGYSFGADVLPFLYLRLSDEVRAQVRSVSLLGLSDTASFEFHVSDWIPGAGGAGLPVAPEVERLKAVPVLCLYGSDEHDSPCPRLKGPGITAAAVAGGHHFGGDYQALARRILEHARE